MNRTATLASWMILVTGSGGCDELDTRNCPPIDHRNDSEQYLLDYELLIPSDCPVPPTMA
jgi:hypothetical protein